MKNSKMRIYLADVYANHLASGEGMPLNIANIAMYVNKWFPDTEMTLFSDAFRLKSALEAQPPHILMLSNYCWNKNLSFYLAQYAKKTNKETICVFGGPNIPIDKTRREKLITDNPFIDFYILYDGEIPSLRLIEEIDSYNFDIDKMKSSSDRIESIMYACKDRFVHVERRNRLESLDEIPSPYASDLMNDYFNLQWTPKIQSVRGCPYPCKYCNMAAPNYKKLIKMSLDRFNFEVDSIVDKMNAFNYKIRNLHLVDDNFGIVPEDLQKAEKLRKTYEKEGIPEHLSVYTAKNINDRLIKIARELREFTLISHTSQSFNPHTLKVIKRPFSGVDKFRETTKRLIGEGFKVMSEMITGLPLETLDSFIDGLNILDDLGFSDYTIYQLIIRDGSPMDNNEFLDKYKMECRYRLYPDTYINIDNKKIVEFERIVYRTSTLSENDYYILRMVGFLLRIQLAMCFKPFFECLKKVYAISGPDISVHIAKKIIDRSLNKEDNLAISLLYDFDRDTNEEIFDSEKDSYSMVAAKNLVHRYRALLMTKAYAPLCDLYYKTVKDMPKYKSADNKGLLEKCFECMKMTDIRTLYFEENIPSLEQIEAYKPSTWKIENLRRMIETGDENTPLRKTPYSFPQKYMNRMSVMNEYISNGESGRIKICNEYDYHIFKLNCSVT